MGQSIPYQSIKSDITRVAIGIAMMIDYLDSDFQSVSLTDIPPDEDTRYMISRQDSDEYGGKVGNRHGQLEQNTLQLVMAEFHAVDANGFIKGKYMEIWKSFDYSSLPVQNQIEVLRNLSEIIQFREEDIAQHAHQRGTHAAKLRKSHEEMKNNFIQVKEKVLQAIKQNEEFMATDADGFQEVETLKCDRLLAKLEVVKKERALRVWNLKKDGKRPSAAFQSRGGKLAEKIEMMKSEEKCSNARATLVKYQKERDRELYEQNVKDTRKSSSSSLGRSQSYNGRPKQQSNNHSNNYNNNYNYSGNRNSGYTQNNDSSNYHANPNNSRTTTSKATCNNNPYVSDGSDDIPSGESYFLQNSVKNLARKGIDMSQAEKDVLRKLVAVKPEYTEILRNYGLDANNLDSPPAPPSTIGNRKPPYSNSNNNITTTSNYSYDYGGSSDMNDNEIKLSSANLKNHNNIQQVPLHHYYHPPFPPQLYEDYAISMMTPQFNSSSYIRSSPSVVSSSSGTRSGSEWDHFRSNVWQGGTRVEMSRQYKQWKENH